MSETAIGVALQRRSARATRALSGVVGALVLLAPSLAHAGLDAVQTWNNTLLTIISATSGQLSDGPPEVAREMAIVGTAMYNAAVNATATGSDSVDAAVNQAAYTAMMALYTPHGTAGNPNTGNPDSFGDIIAGANGGLSIKLGAQIAATYASLSQPVSNVGQDAAVNTVLIPRMGSLTNASDADGSYTAIKASIPPNNTYAAGSPAYPGLVPGASPSYNPDGTLTACGTTNTCPGVYLPPSTTSGGHIAIVPAWETVTPFVNTSAQIAAVAASPGVPYDIGSAAYAQNLMTTYCTGGVGNLATQASVCAAAGITSSTVLQGTTVTSTISTLGTAAPGQQVQSLLTDNALFWNDPGTTEQPPGHWLAITDTTILNAGDALSELQQAQMTQLVAEAESNAASAAWDAKYNYNLWRPITAITGINAPGSTCAYGPAGNWNATLASYGFACDPTWKSYITTPPHPDYVAGHPAFSGAAATILTDYLGLFAPNLLAVPFSNTSQTYCNTPAAALVYGFTSGNAPITAPISNPDGSLNTTIIACAITANNVTTIYDANNTGVSLTNPGGVFVPAITETFDNFADASRDATDSRVNGGIHTPKAIDDALSIGDQIGALLFAQTVPEPSSLGLLGFGLLAFGAARRRRAPGRKHQA